jgi:hypothetical protein
MIGEDLLIPFDVDKRIPVPYSSNLPQPWRLWLLLKTVLQFER